jgi:hypothetical protein
VSRKTERGYMDIVPKDAKIVEIEKDFHAREILETEHKIMFEKLLGEGIRERILLFSFFFCISNSIFIFKQTTKGHFGSVWKGKHNGRDVAVKILKGTESDSSEFEESQFLK